MEIIRLAEPSKANEKTLKEMLHREGLESELYADPPGTRYGRHRHDFDDFVVIVSGMMKIATEKHVWTMKPGDRLDIPAGTVHWAEVVGKEQVRYLSAAD